jgi:hypothetical protein
MGIKEATDHARNRCPESLRKGHDSTPSGEASRAVAVSSDAATRVQTSETIE